MNAIKAHLKGRSASRRAALVLYQSPAALGDVLRWESETSPRFAEPPTVVRVEPREVRVDVRGVEGSERVCVVPVTWEGISDWNRVEDALYRLTHDGFAVEKVVMIGRLVDGELLRALLPLCR